MRTLSCYGNTDKPKSTRKYLFDGKVEKQEETKNDWNFGHNHGKFFFYLVDEVAKRAQMEKMVMKELDHSDEWRPSTSEYAET